MNINKAFIFIHRKRMQQHLHIKPTTICGVMVGVLIIKPTTICGVMVGVLISGSVDRVFELRSGQRVKSKIITLILTASPLSMQHKRVRANTSWIRIGILRPSGATCLPTIYHTRSEHARHYATDAVPL